MAASMSEGEMIPRVPIVVILGATGSGKSKLAIEIAKIFNGEIVSADSMQLYKGLDVITNKVTAEERRMVPHHMLDFLEPHVILNVVDYRNMALKKVEELIGKGKLPLVVGGTNYYIESLLWRVLVAGEVNKGISSGHGLNAQVKGGGGGGDGVEGAGEPTSPNLSSPTPTSQEDVAAEDDESISNEELHKRLSEVDPEMAKSLHPNNRRKVYRSLQVFKQMGKPHSIILREQRDMEGGGPLGGPLRFPNSCILWLKCDPDVLDKRLDDRVDDMLKAGLVDELLDFHRRYNASRLQAGSDSAPDYTKGIFQSIGFKEFHEYLMWFGKKEEVGAGKGDEEGEGKEKEEEKELGEKKKKEKEDEGKRLFQNGVENLKMATRRYARKQVRWINNRFLRQPDRQVPLVYGLDATDPSRWDELALGPATKIVRALLAGEKPEDVEPLPVVPREGVFIEWNGEPKRCEECDRLFVDPLQWKEHLSSKKHRRVVERLKRERNEGGGEAKKMRTE